MKWSFSTLGCAELSLDEILALAKKYDFQGVEIRFLDDSPDLNASLGRYLDRPDGARRILESGVEVVGLGTSYNLASENPGDMDELRRSAILADAVKARHLRIFYGPEWGKALTADDAERARANFSAWREWRADNGVRADIAIETHGCTSDTSLLTGLFENLGERVPIIWDTHHTLILAGEKPEETWKRIGDSVVHMHIKDSVDKPSARHPYSYVLPGEGRFPAKTILALLRDNGYDGFASLEWERKWHPYMPPIQEAFDALRTAGWR